MTYNALCKRNFDDTFVAIIWSSNIDVNSFLRLSGSTIFTRPPVLSATSANNPNLQSVPLIVIIDTETLKIK